MKIFLSHSGLDAALALAIHGILESRFKRLNRRVKFFNTSTPENRFHELQTLIEPGREWSKAAKDYEEKLRRYLAKNLQDSTAYLLLVTPRSLKANSQWIKFEMDSAGSEAMKHRRPFFFPLVAEGAEFSDLPKEAERFQAMKLDLCRADEDFDELAQALARSDASDA